MVVPPTPLLSKLALKHRGGLGVSRLLLSLNPPEETVAESTTLSIVSQQGKAHLLCDKRVYRNDTQWCTETLYRNGVLQRSNICRYISYTSFMDAAGLMLSMYEKTSWSSRQLINSQTTE